MLADFAEEYPGILKTFEEASAVLGYDLWALCQQGPDTELNRTEITQPAMLTAAIALWRLYCAEGGPQPQYLAGHSLGEYSALVAAGVIEFGVAVGLVAERARLMQNAVPAGAGAMAAVIGLDDAAIEDACREAAAGQVVEPVNYNSPGQLVIAGNAEAVERAGALCKAKGARRVLPLPVSVPSHCALMRDAAEQLGESLKKVTFNAPAIPVVQNVTADVETDPERIRDNLVRQLYSPVLWTQSVGRMVELGVTRTLESGPGKVLSGLNKRISGGLEVLAMASVAEFRQAMEKIKSGEVE